MRIRVCALDELLAGTARTITLANDLDGMPRTAVVVRDHQGIPRAYLNLCQHLPVPLDAGSGQFFDPSHDHFECATHGAEYRLDDGYCFAGPCEGAYLESLALVEDQGVIYVLEKARSG
jgi:nitrite reductase/ring-hydroxylating ferredoxin subunit